MRSAYAWRRWSNDLSEESGISKNILTLSCLKYMPGLPYPAEGDTDLGSIYQMYLKSPKMWMVSRVLMQFVVPEVILA